MHHPFAAPRVLLLVCVCVACTNELPSGPAAAAADVVAEADVAPTLDAVADVATDTAKTDTALADTPPADTAAADAWPAFGCTPGHDETCNWLPGASTLAGHCGADGLCVCKDGIGLEATTGKCLDLAWCDPHFVDSCKGNDTTTALTGVCQPTGLCVCDPGFALDANGRCESTVCHGGCPVAGATRCAGGFLQVCGDAGNGCAHHWFTTDNCHLQTCNATATKCVTKGTQVCATDADCPCGCGCSAGQCLCTGALPTTCAGDGDCGPECAGKRCQAGACVAAGAHP